MFRLLRIKLLSGVIADKCVSACFELDMERCVALHGLLGSINREGLRGILFFYYSQRENFKCQIYLLLFISNLLNLLFT